MGPKFGLSKLKSSDRWLQISFPFFSLVVVIAAYGLLINRLGFYWDDWPWVWLFHSQGAARLLEIDQVSRPLAGEIPLAGLAAGRGEPRCLAGHQPGLPLADRLGALVDAAPALALAG